MRRARAIVAGACLIAAACDEDPARSMKIVPRPAAVSPAVSPAPLGVAAVSPAATRLAEAPPPAAGVPRTTAARSSATAARPSGTGASRSSAEVEPPAATDWRQPGCPPPPEASPGPSDFTAAGPCAFKHRGVVACEALGDDFLVTLTRKAGGATLTVYINVEHYHGPGDYRDAQIYLGLQDKFNIYRWSSDKLNITVGSGQQSVTFPATSLEAEPLFTNCTGPITNFQCQGRQFEADFLKTREVVSGTLRCGTEKPK
jgi:hypothetical protein